MKDDKKTSVIKEALVEYQEIQEAAVANAKKTLAETFPEKFNELLKEELNKNKSAKKESYKKLDENKETEKLEEANTNKESVMKDKKEETKKVVNEGEVKKESDPFEEKAPEKGPDVVKEERDKDFMGDVEADTPNKEEPKDGDAFTEKITTKQDTLANKTSVKEEFDMTGLDETAVGTALENAEEDDEVITMDEIEEEISAMNELEQFNTNPTSGPDDGIAYDKLVSMRNQIDEMIQGISEQKQQGGKQSIPGRENGGPTTAMIDEEAVEEQKQQGGKQSIPGRENGGPTTAMIDEEEITDADVEAVLGAPAMEEQEVDENIQHTQTHSNARQVGANDNTNYGKESRLRDAMKNESEEKKISSLIEENKSLTKKLNETKKYKQSVTTLVEQYKTAIEKYRDQLKEMATFNTNLAHVNNLLVNESLALTQEDKIKIINEFKKVDTIAESQEKYKAMLSEMKASKPTLTESVEDKASASIAPSSKQKLDEVTEVTAYQNNEQIDKMKKLIEYAENRGKKKPLNS